MTKFWDKVLGLILSKGQREKHEKYLWDKNFGEAHSPASASARSSLDKPAFPELKPTVPSPTIANIGSQQLASSPKSSPSSSSTTSKSQWSSPHPSRPSSPIPTAATTAAATMTMTTSKVPRAPLPRHPREDRAYITLEPLMETKNAAALDGKKGGQRAGRSHAARAMTSPSTSPSKLCRTQFQPALLYEVPPLSEMHGIGRYRRSVNASESFMDSSKTRDDSYADLLAAAEKDRKRASGEWGNPKRSGNMDTTSPPPPRSAFCSRANSPVRLEYRKEYGDDVDILGEEELAEVDGKLLFCRRKSRGSSGNGKQTADLGGQAGTDNSQAITTSGDGIMTTADIVAVIAKQKVATAISNNGVFQKRKLPPLAGDEETVKSRKRSHEARSGAISRTLKGDKIKVEHVEDLDEDAIETDDEDIEEVESFSDIKGGNLMAKPAKAADKEKVAKGAEAVRKGRKSFKGPGQAGAVGGGMYIGVRGAGRTRGIAGKANGVAGGRRPFQNDRMGAVPNRACA